MREYVIREKENEFVVLPKNSKNWSEAIASGKTKSQAMYNGLAYNKACKRMLKEEVEDIIIIY